MGLGHIAAFVRMALFFLFTAKLKQELREPELVPVMQLFNEQGQLLVKHLRRLGHTWSNHLVTEFKIRVRPLAVATCLYGSVPILELTDRTHKSQTPSISRLPLPGR